jgi:broad specificity phosphatase PhoE
MRTRRLLLLLTLVVGLALPAAAGDPLVVFLVRHAEKELTGSDPALSPAGIERAAALAHTLKDAAIERVHSSDYRRTRDTAAPPAAALGVDVEIYDARDLPALIARLRAAGGRHLVVGHSNTTPDAVKLLGGEPGAPIEEENEYDRLYTVTVDGEGEASTVLTRYGAPSP